MPLLVLSQLPRLLCGRNPRALLCYRLVLAHICLDLCHVNLFISSASFQPFAARTQQYVKEQLGAADEKTQLPDDYIELEKRVDALKQVHQKLLSVTYVLDASPA